MQPTTNCIAKPTQTWSKTRKNIFLTALNWLVQRDHQSRQAHKLRGMSDERLADMGLTRADVGSLFKHH